LEILDYALVIGVFVEIVNKQKQSYTSVFCRIGYICIPDFVLYIGEVKLTRYCKHIKEVLEFKD